MKNNLGKPEVNLKDNQGHKHLILKLKHGVKETHGLVKIHAMTYTAFDLHKTLTEVEGFDPSSDEYYAGNR